MGAAIDSATSFMSQIGRHFSITSLLPTVLFLLWLLALTSTEPWSVPDPAAVSGALTTWSIGKVVGIVAVAVTVGFVSHPLLFATTQLLEGYWGTHPLALRAAAARARTHRRRRAFLVAASDEYGDVVEGFTNLELRKSWTRHELATTSPVEIERARRSLLGGEQGLPACAAYLGQQATARAQAAFPEEGQRVMPTRLGNALRRVEDRTGRQYGLDVMLVAPHFAVIARGPRAAYINDSREALDLAVRMCSFALVAAVVTTAWLAPTGRWVLLAGIPYAIAYLTYRGAIAAAQEWGAALAAAVDIDRFALYEALHLRLPRDTDDERTINGALADLLGGNSEANVEYAHPRSDGA